MRIKSITLDDDEMPEAVTVEMSLDEASVIYALLGNIAPRTVTEELGNIRWGEALDGVATCLSGSLFNRFWDDGARELGATWPGLDAKLRRDSDDGK